MQLRASSTSRPLIMAGAVAGQIREHGSVDIQAMGAAAVNQAVKSISIAQNYLDHDGIEIVTKFSMLTIEIGDAERTAVLMRIFKHSLPDDS